MVPDVSDTRTLLEEMNFSQHACTVQVRKDMSFCSAETISYLCAKIWCIESTILALA